MNVIVARSAGFCMGVRRAVDKARALARSSNSPVHTDGPLIHNEQMMDRLKSEGIAECSDPASIPNGILLVRAHGIPPARRRMLQALPLQLEDATCPDVARTQGLIRKHLREGRHIVIFGDQGHPEVTGLLGYAEGNGSVVQNTDDVAHLPRLDRVCLVAQSTQFPDAYEQIARAVAGHCNDVVVLDTICESTKERQAELRRIAPETDAIVIVGGRNSANTTRLATLARTLKPTFLVQTAAEINPDDFMDFKTVGLTAGASTPDDVIDEVRTRLESL